MLAIYSAHAHKKQDGLRDGQPCGTANRVGAGTVVWQIEPALVTQADPIWECWFKS